MLVEARHPVQLVLIKEHEEQGDWQLTQTVLLLSGTREAGQEETQVEFAAINKGATLTLQVRQVSEVFTQVPQFDAQGSHSIDEVFATETSTGHDTTHCCL